MAFRRRVLSGAAGMIFLTGVVISLVLTGVERESVTVTAESASLLPGRAIPGGALDESGLYRESAVSEAEMIETFERIGTVNSLVIGRHGSVIMEHYLDGMSREKAVNTKSASKSILSLLVGIAIDRGYLNGTGQTLQEMLPDRFDESSDPIKASITLQDLLTMRSGLETTSYYNYGAWVTSRDWVRFILERPLRARPGEVMIYSTGTSHLLSVILSEATGMNTYDFAGQFLFTPLGIEPGFWERDPQGYPMGGNNLFLSPMALWRIGRMVLDGGLWRGKRIVSEEWIRESLSVHTRSNWNLYDYGYMWWIRPAGEVEVRYAWGYGGQFILLLPTLDAVIAVTSDADRNDGTREYEKELFVWLEQQLIPWLRGRTTPEDRKLATPRGSGPR